MITAFDGRNQDNQSTFYRSTPHDLPTSEGPPPLPPWPSLIWYYQNWKHFPVLGHLYRRETVQPQENIGHYKPMSSCINSGLGLDTWMYYFLSLICTYYCNWYKLFDVQEISGNTSLSTTHSVKFCVVNQSICTWQLHLRTVSVCQYIRKTLKYKRTKSTTSEYKHTIIKSQIPRTIPNARIDPSNT